MMNQYQEKTFFLVLKAKAGKHSMARFVFQDLAIRVPMQTLGTITVPGPAPPTKYVKILFGNLFQAVKHNP